MSAHTPGPWFFDSYSGVWCGKGEESELVCSVEDFRSETDGGGDQMRGARMFEGIANARLITAAPAMDLCLALLSLGLARIERSASGRLVEFCFSGIRYSVTSDRTWDTVINLIGWDRARAAIARAEGRQ